MESEVIVAKIGLAKEMVYAAIPVGMKGKKEDTIKGLGTLFDSAYRAITKTIAEAEDSTVSPES